MSIDLGHDYEQGLRMAQPTVLGQHTVRPPPGALGAISVIPPQTIPPLNTNIQFSIIPQFTLSEHPGLAAMDITKIPDKFNWRDDGGKKKNLMSEPGNQMLCGSCWAISAAGIVADNFVVSGMVDWKPNLSTTWCLACYPQLQCRGGNPAKLYEDISRGGISSNHCIDYSWCSENSACNGKATQHFKEQNAVVDLSALVPTCGCYEAKDPHYLYFIDNPKAVSIGIGGLDENNFTNTIKKHIYTNGPVQGGFLVFTNFMPGAFTKINGGVYLEKGTYDNGSVHFDDAQVSSANYKGSHAISIIGWGTEKDVVIDNNGTKKDIPYWYCKNSWTEKWGDGGYFKMAMYPHNQIVQFDKVIVINTPKGDMRGGGMVTMTVSKKPISKTLPQIQQRFLQLTRSKPDDFYSNETHDKGNTDQSNNSSKINWKYILIITAIICLTILLFFVIRKFVISKPSHKTSHSYKPSSRRSGGMIKGRTGSYFAFQL